MNNKGNNKGIFFLTEAAFIAAIYAVLVYLQNFLLPNSTTLAIQIRIAEALTLLSVVTPAAIPGLTIGCFISNFLSIQTMPLDIVFGTLATFLSVSCMYKFRNIRFNELPLISALMPVVINSLIVGIELAVFIPHESQSLLTNFLIQGGLVALGESISVLALGLPFIKHIEKRRFFNMF